MTAAAFRPTAKKCSGEAHWYPARSGVFGPVVLIWEKFDSPGKAKKAAKQYLDERRAPQEIDHDKA